jgi:hypothetical protein
MSPLRLASLGSVLVIALAFVGGCRTHGGGAQPVETAPSASPAITSAPAVDDELVACQARVAAIEARPAEPGAPALDGARPEFLGRVRGEPMVFVREPRATPDAELPPAWLAARRVFERGAPGASRVGSLIARHRKDPAALRALLLREGYAYAPDPLDALALVTGISLPELFTEPFLWIQRGADTRRIERVTRALPGHGETTYRYVDGPLAGRAADLLFGDRVARTEAELAAPLHRDLRALADVEGFDRTRIVRRTDDAILADLRYPGERWARAVLTSTGATLSVACLAEDRGTRDAVVQARATEAPRRRGMLALHATVDHELAEVLRFDRPEGVKGAEHDGELRPVWMTAYLQGRSSFTYEDASYPVFDAQGNAWPPQVCVDFVLDSFERTSGTWFAPRGATLARTRGRLDFDQAGIANRRGVLAFGAFAEAHPELFEARRFVGPERIPFKERSRFFAFLEEHADEVRAGDVVAIHGMKADQHIHQHAILVEWIDPVTGFPSGLADQMKRPRRRTWEGIMAEAPLRSLLFRVRPRDAVFEKLDPGPG